MSHLWFKISIDVDVRIEFMKFVLGCIDIRNSTDLTKWRMTPKISQDRQSIDTEDGATTLMSEISLLSFTLTHEKPYIRKFLMNVSQSSPATPLIRWRESSSMVRCLTPAFFAWTAVWASIYLNPFGWGHALLQHQLDQTSITYVGRSSSTQSLLPRNSPSFPLG